MASIVSEAERVSMSAEIFFEVRLRAFWMVFRVAFLFLIGNFRSVMRALPCWYA